MLSIQLLGNKGVHFLPFSRGNAVPDLGRPVVQVVHTVKIHVFSVPA